MFVLVVYCWVEYWIEFGIVVYLFVEVVDESG